jgi:aspartate 1-decarboxylase
MKETAILVAVLAATFLAPMTQAQKKKLSVQIVNRQSSETEYTYTVPGYSTSNCNASVYGNTASANCVGSGAPATSGSYSVNGATFSLLLPDDRIVVVNCNSKLNWTDWSTTTARRGCRQPITNTVEAEFNGDNAKLEWPVSIDGKKKQNETYKIIGILTKTPAPGK